MTTTASPARCAALAAGRLAARLLLVAGLLPATWMASWIAGQVVDWRTPPAPETWLGHDFRMDRAALSTQAEEPFLFSGDVVDPGHGAWDRYAPALARRPDTLSCLRASESGAARPNLLAFDWYRVRGYDREVCLFRVATSLGSVERVEAWLAGSGVKVPSHSGRTAGSGETEVYGAWTTDEAWRRPDRPIGLFALSISAALQWLTRRNHDPDYDWHHVIVLHFDRQERVVTIYTAAW